MYTAAFQTSVSAPTVSFDSCRSLIPFVSRWAVSDKSTRIPISLFHSALRIAGMDVPSDEAECLVANMIYRGFIRGYISHEKQMVVLAIKNAFPRIADCPAPYATL